jgi:hypothetical protein
MKHRPLSAILVALLFSASGLLADTIPGGDVSGTWYAANSPYYIAGSITIPYSSTLTIEPGVLVKFLGFYPFTVYGLLEAIGTEADSIRLFPQDTVLGWQGLRFADAPDSSCLAFCTISRVGNIFVTTPGAIVCTNSSPVITHCRISDNRTNSSQWTHTAGIALINSGAAISWCDIIGNRGGGAGGGINMANSSPVITGCLIRGNMTVQKGGGIYVRGGSNPVITGCTIERDTSNMYGGGIAVDGGTSTISGCTFTYNEAYDGGGGIAVFGGSVTLDHCTFEFNRCWTSQGRGGGAFVNGGTLTIDHCTMFGDYVFEYEYGQEVYTGGSATMTIANSILYSECWLVCLESSTSPSVSYSCFHVWPHSPRLYFCGNVPSGLGEITQVNHNGDSCDLYCNIFTDPLFVDYPQRDYNLQAGSPCIDAGDPDFPLDPDSTFTDMGAFWYSQVGIRDESVGGSSRIAGRPVSTIVRGLLNLQSTISYLQSEIVLLDATGRKVMDLQPGENDVRHLAPGVYFIRSEPSAVNRQPRAALVRKVVILR